MTADPFTVCECGHVRRAHTGPDCRACPCNNFTPADDAQAAILAGATRKAAQVAAANAARRHPSRYRGAP